MSPVAAVAFRPASRAGKPSPSRPEYPTWRKWRREARPMLTRDGSFGGMATLLGTDSLLAKV